MRPILLISGLFLFLLNAFGADSSASTPGFGIRFGMGWTQTVNETLSSTLKGLNQGTIDPATLIPVEWGYSLLAGGLLTEVTVAQTANNTLTTLSGSHRSRFVWNATEVTFGSRWNLAKDLLFQAGLGVGVSKYVLQTYNSGSASLSDALAQTGQVSLVSSWNWTPVATSRLSWRFLKFPNADTGLSLGVGVTAGANLLPAQWKLNDDVGISGLSKPWDASFRYQVWLGLE